MSRRKPEGDYEVGYAKPPRSTRFQPGQSGNPGGKRKRAKSLSSVLHTELNRKVAVTVGGKRVRMTVRDVVVKQLLKKAGEGDMSSIRVVLNVEAGWLASEAAPSAQPETTLSKEDDEFLQHFIQQIKDEDKSS